MSLYTIVKQLLLPPGILLVLLALAFLLVRGTLGRMLLFITWSLLLAMSLPALSVQMIAALEQYPALPPEDLAARTANAGAIVVLAAGTYTAAPEYGGNTVGPNSLQRIRYAAWLHRRTGLPIYVSGGYGRNAPGPPMADALREEFGVPVALVETDSRTTWENAAYTAPLLRANGIERILLVTQAWHMPRSVDAFERAGIEVIPAPTYFAQRGPEVETHREEIDRLRDWLPQAPAFQASAFVIHELLGQAYYRLKEQFAAPLAIAPIGG
ncbi:MAG: YdcF family protein [Chromatiaceae bacterium]|nr:MAG: YdcF family protein [Chromatiaceae bacterium]